MSLHRGEPAAQAGPNVVNADRQRDQLALVLEISRAAAALDLHELVERVGSCMQRTHWRWDSTSVCLYEPAEQVLRQHHLIMPPHLMEGSRQYIGRSIPIEGTLSGRAFTQGELQVANSRAEYMAQLSPEWAASVDKLVTPAFSSCIVPLRSGGRKLGTLALAAPRDGAFDSLSVAFIQQVADAIAPAVDNALVYREIQQLKQRLSEQNTHLEAELHDQAGQIVGETVVLRTVMAHVESVAATRATVLIQGETGTGKELIARAIHRISPRRDGSFIKLNCAAIPAGVLESELFGHEKGAFTGAVAQKQGRFELAEGGTLFLDEVGELPPEVQPKLLRVLQEQEVERVGSTRTIKVDVRVVAATNRNLSEMVAQGSFRSDLFYRLNVFPIFLPALRDRREDIPRLVQHFVERSGRRLKKSIAGVDAATMSRLTRYSWPGNIRELENVIERAIILSAGGNLRINPMELPTELPTELPIKLTTELEAAPGPAPSIPAGPPLGSTLADAERAFIVKALEERNWVVGGKNGAATRLGLSRTTLQARMRKLGIASRARAQRGNPATTTID
jgi:formate hydrogenlyase transcriptional activator